MKIKQLIQIILKLDSSKRIKFQNGKGWDNQTMAVNAILEEGNSYIFIWACHPHIIKEHLLREQKLVWYNPNCPNFKIVGEYFPNFKNL